MGPKLELYIFPFSPPARAAWMVCEAVGVPVEIKKIDIFKGEQNTPEYLKINPQHTVPTLVDGDFSLWESRAIAAYIVDKYGGSKQYLYPKDLQKRAVVDRLLVYDASTVWIGVVENWVSKIHGKPAPSIEREKEFYQSLDYLNEFLKDKKFLTGNDVTIADISLNASLSLWEAVDADMTAWGNLLAWYERVKALPFWDECNKGLQELRVFYQNQKSEPVNDLETKNLHH